MARVTVTLFGTHYRNMYETISRRRKKVVTRLCCYVPRIPVNICKQARNEIGITVAHLIGTRVTNIPILDRVIRLFSFNLMTIIDYPV
jgi:hypothetical protein